jgi:hypothetical protein
MCVLANTTQVAQVPGRKLLIQDRTRHANRLHKVLEDAGITLTSVATRLLGASGRAMLDTLVAGTTTRRSSLTSPGRGGPVAAVRLSAAPPRWITSYGTRPASPRLPWRSLLRGDPRWQAGRTLPGQSGRRPFGRRCVARSTGSSTLSHR